MKKRQRKKIEKKQIEHIAAILKDLTALIKSRLEKLKGEQ